MKPPVKLGDRVRVTGVMPDEPDPIAIGTQGTVSWVGQWTNEYTEQIGVDWDNGRRLILLSVDPYEVITAQERKSPCS
jgi:hypothetical protein